MIAVSVEWPRLRDRVFTRLEERAAVAGAAASGADDEVALLVRVLPAGRQRRSWSLHTPADSPRRCPAPTAPAAHAGRG